MDKSQQLAAQAVGQVLAGRNLTVTLEGVWKTHPQLTSQQRGITQDLSYGTLRHLSRLQAYLAQLLTRKLDDERVQLLLLVALYQLEFSNNAAHAVVDHAVKAASHFNKPWAKGLVNAVLRNFLRRRETLQAALGTDEVAQYSYPGWWITQLKNQYPASWQAMLEAGNQRPPMTLRVNRRRLSVASYQKELADVGILSHALGNSALVLEQALPVEKLPGFLEGVVSVQDYGAQFAAPLLDIQDGMRVLDACCAPGGKTGHILELADVLMTAVDNDADRISRTRSNLVRLGLAADLVIADAANPFGWWDGEFKFDRILADVPCSASGIVRRHVDIKWLRREQDLRLFAVQQSAILHGLWPLLAIGGKLLYATCSVFAQENQHQIDTFLQEQTNARQLPVTGMTHGQLLPCTEHDGVFYALLEKV